MAETKELDHLKTPLPSNNINDYITFAAYCQSWPVKSIRRILILLSEIFLQLIKNAAPCQEAAFNNRPCNLQIIHFFL